MSRPTELTRLRPVRRRASTGAVAESDLVSARDPRNHQRPTAFVAAARNTPTNERLRAALAAVGYHAFTAPPAVAAASASTGDLVLGRLDVLPTLDGVEPGLDRLRELRDVRVINHADALLACHDKLATAALLARASVPQPRWTHLRHADSAPEFPPPYVVKPRFGSWGKDVHLCESCPELATRLAALSASRWFWRHGALVQELVERQGFDLRLLVAAGEVVGAIERVAAPGEWRTNIALGGTRRRTNPPVEACAIAARAAAAVRGDLVGVDLIPAASSWRVIEINGAVDFNDDYSLDGGDVFDRTIRSFISSGEAETDGPRRGGQMAAAVDAHAGIPEPS